MGTANSEHLEYNKDNEPLCPRTEVVGVPADQGSESGSMSYNPLLAKLHESEPKPAHCEDAIIERKSDSHGVIKIYPPSAATEMWKILSWRMVTETSPEGKPLDVTLKASCVWEVYNRPYFLDSRHLFTPLD